MMDHARALVKSTMERMPILEYAALASILYRLPVREPNRDFPTMAVWTRGDGVIRLAYNPEFTCQLDDNGRVFVLMHEAYHILLAHLSAPHYRRGDEYWTIATEATINRLVLSRTGLKAVPAGGVDPEKIYAGYAKKEKELGREPVTIGEFYASDVTAYTHLSRTKPTFRNLRLCDFGGRDGDSSCPTCGGEGEIEAPQQGQGQQGQGQDQNQQDQSGQDQSPQGQGQNSPESGGGEGQDGQGHGNGGKIPCPNCGGSGENPNGHPFDPETLKEVVESTIRQGIIRAIQGDKALQGELEALAQATPEASKMWGNLGLGALRGETDKGRAHPVWQYLLRDAMASRLSTEEGKPAYNRKTGHFPTADPNIGNPLSPVGFEDEKFALIAVDTSGSMPQYVLDRVGKMVGEIPNCHARWLWWDAEAYEFEPGDGIMGGGGTTTQSVVRWIEENLELEFPDVVLMITDGHVGAEDQQYPYPFADRWIWLITEGGNTWPHDYGMKMVEVDDLSDFVP